MAGVSALVALGLTAPLAAFGGAVSPAGAPDTRFASTAGGARSAAATPGVSNVVRPVRSKKGKAKVCRAPKVGCKALTKATTVPIGRYLDTRGAGVILATRRVDGTAARTTVSGAIFKLEQKVDADAVLVARLASGFRSTCGADPPKGTLAATRAAASTKLVRRLRASGSGSFRIAGAFSSATTQSASFVVADFCGATSTSVTTGSVDVTQPGTTAVQTVTARGNYVAMPTAPPAPEPPPAPSPPKPPPSGKPGVSNAVRPIVLDDYPGPTKVCTGLGTGCEVLTGDTIIPMGRILDTRKGAIRLETRLPDGTVASMLTYGARFQLTQAKTPGAVLETRIVGGNFVGICGRKGPGQISASLRGVVARAKGKGKTVNSQTNKGKGRYRSTAGYGSGTVEGTTYTMEDRCDGTFVRVTTGTVKVFDRVRRRYLRVRAGHSHLIKAPQG